MNLIILCPSKSKETRSMSDIVWTSRMVKKLMVEYKQRPCLWDSTHESYRVQIAKYEARKELAALFDCDIYSLRKKINSIFASYRREKAKVRLGGKSTWFLYPYMSFLKSHLEFDASVESIPNEESDECAYVEEEQYIYDEEIDHIEQDTRTPLKKEEPKMEMYIKSERKCSKFNNIDKTRLRLKRKSSEAMSAIDSKLNKLGEAIKLIKKSEERKRKDECDTFAEYVGEALRKHDERTRCMIKQAINNILFEQEMKKYTTRSYAVVITDSEENPLILGDQECKLSC